MKRMNCHKIENCRQTQNKKSFSDSKIPEIYKNVG